MGGSKISEIMYELMKDAKFVLYIYMTICIARKNDGKGWDVIVG